MVICAASKVDVSEARHHLVVLHPASLASVSWPPSRDQDERSDDRRVIRPSQDTILGTNLASGSQKPPQRLLRDPRPRELS